MMRKLLIANRGEIACRIMRTARRLGITPVAVYSEVDAHAMHVELADEAYLLGPAPARDSYLSIDKIIEVARRSGSDAIHPGYGFLAENADFAEACAANGLIFVGPPPQAMRLLGSKSAAKAAMIRAGVPVAPGSSGRDDAELLEAARAIGFPLLVKASAGGGGRGMRIVRAPEEMALALESARREARAAFGDDALFVEKYFAGYKHIEIQIFADSHGGVISFLERDCSLQRRHQKVVEETPAPGLTPSLRAQMSDAAIRAARTAGYVGAGTVEFLVGDDHFYFLEMNTRLQVEHPVTEMVSNQDLVEWQLRIACGAPLPLTQSDLRMSGCAIEARICAEDPARGFLPSFGKIVHFRAPQEAPFFRIDAGVRAGDSVTPYYDSLLAKLIVFGESREQALRRLQTALDEVEIVGVVTNLDLLRAISKSDAMASGDYDTEFVANTIDMLICPAAMDTDLDRVLLAASASVFLADVRRAAREASGAVGDEWSPWAEAGAWRLYAPASYELRVTQSDRMLSALILRPHDGGFSLSFGDVEMSVEAQRVGDRLSLLVDGVKHEVSTVVLDDGVVIVLRGRNYLINWLQASTTSNQAPSDDRVLAPMPATVTRIAVKSGDVVSKGETLIVVEAMKMEIALAAPHDGVIKSVDYSVGDMAKEGAELVTIARKDVE
ncbi:biotin carboxylase N-terminal domain-containing protein [Methylocystis sp. B8]|uniref:acetyl/propionyl/methylcrotonyl-CoA carboxylase subunit alpha n=1 Tax=Methylocystis sp. B8 TaxID=544938 RepID=UPI0010FE4B4D|nr:biotin carboxylase N-terminal domain-containing protein [Methylocystis sp. B8]TLG78680.1 ATP-grasp domain-containing protein [Methylocystis sp. B8]